MGRVLYRWHERVERHESIRGWLGAIINEECVSLRTGMKGGSLLGWVCKKYFDHSFRNAHSVACETTS